MIMLCLLLNGKKNVKIEPIDLTFRNDGIIYCDDLPYYHNIDTMHIISFYSERDDMD